MSSDTRPVLTSRWLALERKGWRFNVSPYPYESKDVAHVDIVGVRNTKEYKGVFFRKPIPQSEEEDILDTFEFWERRDNG